MLATKPSHEALAPDDAARALETWRTHDLAHALHGPDREAVASTDAPRSLVLELLARAGHGRDLYNACAQLGRLFAGAGASPTLAVATLDGAAGALAEAGIPCDATRLGTARASLAEGYFSAVLEAERATARSAWEYPACAVRISRETVAIAAGYPADDGEALADWSARVALCASRDGYRRAVLAGPSLAADELAQALALVGIERVSTVEPRGWLSSLLRR